MAHFLEEDIKQYIHLNPVTAKMIKQADKYFWSSYQGYLNPKKKIGWLQVDEILFIGNEEGKPETYRRFVENGLDSETRNFYDRKNTSVIFGTKGFKEKLLEKLDKYKIAFSLSDYNRTRELPTMDQISRACASYFDVDEKSLYKSVRGRKNEPRKLAMYGCRMWAAEKLSEIARRYQCNSHASVTNAVKEIQQRLEGDKKLGRVLGGIKKLIGRDYVK